ncbi:MAG: sugar-binding domain-containing protein [Candidatus Binatus sp.]|uniref:beta-mannosidase n=2 Tax=Candidatus Binatus sp. TaxID=2811406 RepID=UPI003BB0754D
MPDHKKPSSSAPSVPTMLRDWRLKDFAENEGVAARAFDASDSDDGWIKVEAPGDVYLVLHAAGRIPDPFGDRAEKACAWVKDREWWWRTDFEAPQINDDQRLILEFQGLDTFATIWLNGEIIGRSENMFRAVRSDVTARVHPGKNRLAVCFRPTSSAVIDREMPTWPIISDSIKETKRNFIRKAQFGWGWDWGPTLPTVGIWKPVSMRTETSAALRTVKFTTLELSPTHDRAKVSVEIEAEVFGTADALTAEIALVGPADGAHIEGTIDLKDGRGRFDTTVVSPKLWWTPELGESYRYDLKIAVKADGRVVEHRVLKVGIRTIALDQSPDPDEPGASFFRFVLNEVPIFARGVCWIPASSFVAAVDEAHYRRLLEAAVEANMNMVRVWGGGVYEHDAFYDLCDELGLLVWQDFMFACAPYPEHDPIFIENVVAEVAYQIERLRNHPSLALWCGNNEAQVVQGFMNAVKRRNDPLPGDLFYSKKMPDAVAALDPTTPYWPGSPFGGPNANSMIAGDVHDWTVWHGMPPVPVDRAVGKFDLSPESVAYTRYAEDMGRFISEYGIQASPVMETLTRCLPEDQRSLGSDALLNRIKDHPKNKVDAMLVSVTGLPTSLEQYVDYTQITQAEGLKFGVEHFRRRKPHCSGSLIWQFNDCWPGISWSLIDYYGFAKASYFFVRRAYAPVMASFKAMDDGSVELWIVNDTLNSIDIELVVALKAFAGGTVWSDSIAARVGANRVEIVWRAESDRLPGDRRHVLTVRSRNDIFPANRHFFAPIKDLDRPAPPAPEIKFEQRGSHEIAVHLGATDYLYFVHLLVADERTRFSDNYFDLADGETTTVVVRNEAVALSPDNVVVRWR